MIFYEYLYRCMCYSSCPCITHIQPKNQTGLTMTSIIVMIEDSGSTKTHFYVIYGGVTRAWLCSDCVALDRFPAMPTHGIPPSIIEHIRRLHSNLRKVACMLDYQMQAADGPRAVTTGNA